MNGTALVRTIFAFASLAVAGFPGAATAQFFYNASITSIGPATCTTTEATAAVSGTFSYFLPDSPNNGILILSVNGGSPSTQLLSITPPSGGPTPIAGVTVTLLAPTPLPWTAVIEQFAAVNGQPVGSGVRGVAVCPASGPGTITITSVTAGSAAPVPALPEHGAAMLSALVVLAFALHLRRSRRRA